MEGSILLQSRVDFVEAPFKVRMAQFLLGCMMKMPIRSVFPYECRTDEIPLIW